MSTRRFFSKCLGNQSADALNPLFNRCRAAGDAAASAPERLSVAISTRLTSLRDEYRKDLESLNDERSSLRTEVEELRQARDLFAEETNTLNKRNTELADLTVEANRKLEGLRAEVVAAQKQLAEVKAAALSQSQSQTSLQSQDKAPVSTPAHQQAKTSKYKALPSSDTPLTQGQAPAQGHQQQQQHIRKVMSASPSLNSSTGSSITLVSSQPMSQASSSASTNHALPPTPQAGADEGVSMAQVAHKVDPVASQMTVRKFKCVFPSSEGSRRCALTAASCTDGGARKVLSAR